MKLYHIKRDHLVHIMCETHAGIFWHFLDQVLHAY